jgi:tRNA G46 methylase TrmB
MFELSAEQAHILTHIKNGKNVVVDSCAGTGKTTLILSVAKELADKQLLQMTYNSMLRYEVKDRVKRAEIKNMKVHTFHSLAVKYYLPTCFTDTGIRYILLKNPPPIVALPKFDVFVLDEAQDMTLIYFQFMVKVARDTGSPIQLLILGDYMQGLYEFKGADTRFLTLADTIWRPFPFLKTQEFEKCTMKMSYRITRPMCSFVNRVMLGKERMEACKDGEPVTYIRNNRRNMEIIVAGEILKLFEEGYRPSDIFVLGPSVKGANSNVRHLENILSERGIPCHVPMLENDKIDERVVDKKVVFSTFHCVKGRERKIIFILGFDNNYFRCYARTLPKDVCPNTLYVAATRGTERLYVLEGDSYRGDRPLEFLQMSHVEMKQQGYIRFRGQHQTYFVDDEERDKGSLLITKHYLTPTELIKFIPENVMEEISEILDRIFIKEEGELDELDIPGIIETKRGFFEEISDLNGIAIPCIYYDHLMKGSPNPPQNPNILLELIRENVAMMRANDHQYLKEIVNSLPENPETTADYLFLANISVAVQETLYFKLKQIDRDEYNWLSESILSECKARLDRVIDDKSSLLMEETIIYSGDDKAHRRIDEFLTPIFDANTQFRFTARVDLISDSTVWELKCTSKISLDHMLQVVIYAWLWKMHSDELPSKEFKIFNIRTRELLSLNATLEDLNTIMIAMLKGKYKVQEAKTDEEFIASCSYGLL